MSLIFGQDRLCRFCAGAGGSCVLCHGTGLEPKAHARNTDPETSHAAAASISSERIRVSQQVILEALRTLGPSTDETLYKDSLDVRFLNSVSGARTRRSELVTLGLVKDSGRREVLQTGRRAIVWEAL